MSHTGYVHRARIIEPKNISKTPGVNNAINSFQNQFESQRGNRTIGNYTVGEKLGKGTFGKVMEGIHKFTTEKVAIKILDKNKIKDKSDVERVRREIHIFKKVQFPFITQLYEIIDTPNHIYLIMEHADSGELFDYIVKHGHINERDSCKFFHMIIDSIECCHQLHIIHRDLKPENILLQKCNENNFYLTKLIDFGLSNTNEGNIKLKTACGSPCYAAPEMIAGKMYNGELADIWSLGVVLFAMVCGYLPFEDENTSILYKKILRGKYETPNYLSFDIKDLLKNILEVNPEKRYNVNEIRAHVWYNQIKMPVSQSSVKPDGKYDIAINENILNWVIEFGFDYSKTKDALLNNLHNPMTSTYYLLKKKVDREGFPLSRKQRSDFKQVPEISDKNLSTSTPLATTPNQEQNAVKLKHDQPTINTNLDKKEKVVKTNEVSPNNEFKPVAPDPLPQYTEDNIRITLNNKISATPAAKRPPTAPAASLTENINEKRPVNYYKKGVTSRPSSTARGNRRYGDKYQSPYTQRNMISVPKTPAGTNRFSPARASVVRCDDMTVSFKLDFQELMKKLVTTMKQLEISFRMININSMVLEKLGVVIETSITLQQKDGIKSNIVSFHKLSGDDWIFKQVGSNIIQILKL